MALDPSKGETPKERLTGGVIDALSLLLVFVVIRVAAASTVPRAVVAGKDILQDLLEGTVSLVLFTLEVPPTVGAVGVVNPKQPFHADVTHVVVAHGGDRILDEVLANTLQPGW